VLFGGSSSGIEAGEITFVSVGTRSIIPALSRLRRLGVSDPFFLISRRVLPRRGILSASELARLPPLIQERREKHKFLLTAGVFLPYPGHAIFYPPPPLTISRVREFHPGRCDEALPSPAQGMRQAVPTALFGSRPAPRGEYQEKVEMRRCHDGTMPNGKTAEESVN